jgi:hypothetical protein
MDGGTALMCSSIPEVVGSGIEIKMFSDLRKNGCSVRPTGVSVPAFAMKVVQSEKDLFCDALRNGQGHFIPSRWRGPRDGLP